MRIASFTMVGQYPHGINLHVRNLKWALGKEDKIFIITLPEIIKDFNLCDDDQVKYISFQNTKEEPFINFWGKFPETLSSLNIKPEWFLFMESDIWFYNKLDLLPSREKEIFSFLPLQNKYHAIMIDDKVIHPRVWEGGILVNGDVVRCAIDYGISFSFVKKFFHEGVKLTDFKESDTFDEFGIYCALIEKTEMKYFDYCIHLRGPESLHRKYPNLYNGCDEEDLKYPQNKMPYLCIFTAIAPYYIDAHFCSKINWNRITKKDDFIKVKTTAHEWMQFDECSRLYEIINLFDTNDFLVPKETL